MDYFFQKQRWTDTFLSLHVKKFKRIILFLLIAFSAAGAKAADVPTSWKDVTFNENIRYSQWVINSRISDFYANQTQRGFYTYDKNGTETGKSKGNLAFDYVPGLVAKAVLEAYANYSTFDWSKPWFYSVMNYAKEKTYTLVATSKATDFSKITLDNMNACKMYFPLMETGALSTDAKSTGETAIANVLTDMKKYNDLYVIGNVSESGVKESTNETVKSMFGGWFHKPSYKDQMWCDGLYMGAALLAQIVNYKNSIKNVDPTSDWNLITKQFTISWNQLYNSEKGLLYHAFTANPKDNASSAWAGISNTSGSEVYHSAAFWGRAMGWYFLALVDVLEQMPSNNSNRATLIGYLEQLAAGLAKYQDGTGCWYQVVDEKDESLTDNYLESSCTSLFAAAYLKAVRLGFLTTNGTYDYKTIGVNAFKGAVNQFMKYDTFEPTGTTVQLVHNCASAGLGGTNGRTGSREYYIKGTDVGQTNTYTEGKVMGAFIMAATEYEIANPKDIRFSYDLAPAYDLAQGGSIKAEALGSGTITYQWFNASDNSLVFEGQTFAPTESGKYYCKATSGSTEIQTSTTTVTVSENVASTDVLQVTTNRQTFDLTQTNIQNYDYASVSTDNWSTKTIDETAYILYNMSKSERKITLKVSGASSFEVKVQNKTNGRKYDISVTDANGNITSSTITHTGTGVESSGIINTNSIGEITIELTGGGDSVYPYQIIFYTGTSGHTITYNYNGHGENNTTDNATALPNPLPKPTADGYTFVGWYTDEPLTQEATPGDELTDDVTLYAKWTPITDLFTLTVVTSETVNVTKQNSVKVSSEYATITGGSAQLYNGHSEPKDMISGNQINLNGSSASYLKITLDNTLKAGDEIIINPATSSFILKATASTSTTNAKSFTGSYVIQEGDAVVGKKVIYLYKGSNSLIGDINITRDYPESDSRATFTYGSSQLTFTETTEGTYTTTLEVGASKKGQTITITPSKQDGATIKKDGSTVSGDITITAPSKIGNTDTHTYTVTSKDGSSTTTYIINVKVVKEKITLKYSDSNGNTEWTWNSTTTPTQPTFVQPTVKAYIKNAEGKDELLTDASLSYTYESDVTSVATVDASSGKITIAESGNGGAKIYATLKENENYYADPAFFNVLLEQGYSFSVKANVTAPAINTSKYITRTTGGTEEKLVKMTFGGWKWEGYANKDATEKTLGSYKVVRGDKTTYYTDKWNDSGGKASDIASIDGHYYSWNGVNDAVDESKAASDKAIYGSIRYGWFKSPVHDNDGKTTESYPYTLPVRGSFMTFEPTMNGTLTIYIFQNGAWNTNDNGGTYVQGDDGSITYEKGDIIPGQFRPHAFQVVNQRGLTVQEFSPNYSVSTKQKVDSRYYCMFQGDKDYNQTKYNNPYNVAKWTEFADYMSTEEQKRAHDSWNSGPLGAQKIIELDNGSFLAVQKGIVKYTFHVTGNETYYFFSNFSKMGFSGANFVPDVSQPQETVSDKISTLELSDVTAYNKITATETGKNIEGTDLKEYTYKIGETEIAPVAGVTIPQFYSIKLKRTFKPNQWTTLSLPFNLTQTEVEQIFGKGTQIIVFDKAKITSARTYLTFFYHEIQNVLPGYPYLIRPTLVDANDNQMETKSNSADNTPTYTITKDGDKLTLTEFTVYNKAINPFIEQHEFKSGGYTAKCTPSYCTANENGNYSKLYKEGDIFVSEGNGTVYISEGKSYGKGYRSYIEKDKTGTTTTTAKALSISFSGVEDGDDNGTTTEIRVTELADDVIQTLGIGGVYNLNGQKVADTTRNLPAGIYIVNGRKVVVK